MSTTVLASLRSNRDTIARVLCNRAMEGFWDVVYTFIYTFLFLSMASTSFMYRCFLLLRAVVCARGVCRGLSKLGYVGILALFLQDVCVCVSGKPLVLFPGSSQKFSQYSMLSICNAYFFLSMLLGFKLL